MHIALLLAQIAVVVLYAFLSDKKQSNADKEEKIMSVLQVSTSTLDLFVCCLICYLTYDADL